MDVEDCEKNILFVLMRNSFVSVLKKSVSMSLAEMRAATVVLAGSQVLPAREGSSEIYIPLNDLLR